MAALADRVMAVLHERPTDLAHCEEMLLQAQARAEQACRNHDRNDEWEAENDWEELWAIRDSLLPDQRKP